MSFFDLAHDVARGMDELALRAPPSLTRLGCPRHGQGCNHVCGGKATRCGMLIIPASGGCRSILKRKRAGRVPCWPFHLVRPSDAKPAPEPLRPLMLLDKDRGKGEVRRIGRRVEKLDLHARFSFVQPAGQRSHEVNGYYSMRTLFV